MKIKINPGGQEEIDAFAKFKYLWKTEDPDWVEQRKKDWETQWGKKIHDIDKKYKARFFVYGEEPPSAIIGDGLYDYRVIDFHFGDRLGMTPFETEDQILDFFNCTIDKKILDSKNHGRVRSIHYYYSKLPNAFEMVEKFTKVFFNPNLFGSTGPRDYNNRSALIAPKDFVSSFSGVSSAFNVNEFKLVDYWQQFSFDYFQLCLEPIELLSERKKRSSLKSLVSLYEDIFRSLKKHSLDNSLLLKKQLVELAESPQGTPLLKEAYETAKENIS